MDGRTAASQIASASAKSFLLPLTKGRTKCGEISLTWCPNALNVRACACLHDDRASGKICGKFHKLLARHFPAEHLLTLAILPMQVKGVLTEIDPYQRHVLHDGSPW
ncbi:hypothetical protein PTE31013_04906 [Pandoraea terrigena]|uniref:Uncharacterized protein n=1 Tax=Pandoraea terrigena TaxID=2508292 RepID=A0A5E4YXS7_9BURK|nr:hypothetical protein PTE31013_04906 [Pandoraea terrigena]